MRPPHDGRMYAIVFTIFLQCFPCTPYPCVGWTSSAQATAPLPPAPGNGREAQAVPRGSSPSPALPTVRMLHARTPIRAPAAHHVSILSQAVLSGMPVVDPTACQPPGEPDLSATPVGAGSRPHTGVPACLRVRCRYRASVEGCDAGALAYLPEQGVRTYWRNRCVPTGEGVRTYWRRGAYLLKK